MVATPQPNRLDIDAEVTNYCRHTDTVVRPAAFRG
jgi:hypothetical protein